MYQGGDILLDTVGIAPARTDLLAAPRIPATPLDVHMLGLHSSQNPEAVLRDAEHMALLARERGILVYSPAPLGDVSILPRALGPGHREFAVALLPSALRCC